MAEAAELLATVIGQDLEAGDDGMLRIARKVAKDRVISTVDPEARHGHKTRVRGFDGYKGHVAVDPDSEIITDTTVTPGNAGDAAVANDLIDDLLDGDAATGPRSTATRPTGPASSNSTSTTTTSRRAAGPNRRRRPAACSPRTASPLTSTTTP